MKLTLSPVAGLPGAPETTASVAGDVLTVGGVDYDLAAVPEGGTAAPSGAHPFIGEITRQGGDIHAAIRWTYGDDADRAQPTDPAHWQVSVAAGPVPSPIVKTPATEDFA